MNYNGYNTRKKKKSRSLLIIAAILVLGIYINGLTLGSDSEKREAISEAISENMRLKQELAQKDSTINDLSQRITELENPPEATPEPKEDSEEPSQGSPRDLD